MYARGDEKPACLESRTRRRPLTILLARLELLGIALQDGDEYLG